MTKKTVARKLTKVEVYDTADRVLAVGDRIKISRNDIDFVNGEVGRVVALKGDVAVLETPGGVRKEINLEERRQWDHAYASTVHSAQGLTEYRTLFLINAPEGGGKQNQLMAKVFGDRSFGVGATRASHEMAIYTNDKAGAAGIVGAKQEKLSAVENIEKAQDKAHEKGANRQIERA